MNKYEKELLQLLLERKRIKLRNELKYIKIIDPDVGFVRPPIKLSRVVLPHPDLPAINMKSFFFISISTFFTWFLERDTPDLLNI